MGVKRTTRFRFVHGTLVHQLPLVPSWLSTLSWNCGLTFSLGWAVCPYDLYLTQRCLTAPAWMDAPVVDKVLLTAYRQKATTSYHARDFSILHTKPTGNADIHPLDTAEYRAIWDKILIADATSSEEDKTMINSFTWSLAWLIRLYDDDYPDDSTTPLAYLQNFLAVPLQFTLACVILLNGTGIGTPANPSSSWLPDEMITTATGGVLMPRFVGKESPLRG
ncbi:hypothetical protein B0T14DRAFT_595235 [Immersiella caudata]|uniref:Uncharacterized protein n=1 Tax=Immersiella caudata TaxID=314043 RepID=A0AA39U4Y5_9PEZI|nr:hypothetical protein B0T14DRAFT_595235 [Immersiella caudata]